ncbi:MAG: hypothetical protein LBF22_09320, partial [Deltaproteobacteria bacterium]|nr:hypothetical protein [Deltaproteobacteria bacterium]
MEFAKKLSLKPHALSRASMCYEPEGHVTHKKKPGKTWPEDKKNIYSNLYYHTSPLLEIFFVSLGGAKKTSLKPHALSKASMC